jgi:plastocyanin
MKLRLALPLFALVIAAFGIAVPVLVSGAHDDRGENDASVSPLRDTSNSAAVRSGGGTTSSPTAATVRIEEEGFVPRVVEVTGGGRVTWIDATGGHQVLRLLPAPGVPRRNVTVQADGAFEVTFDEPGLYEYRSVSDPDARGEVLVN